MAKDEWVTKSVKVRKKTLEDAKVFAIRLGEDFQDYFTRALERENGKARKRIKTKA